MAGVSLQASPSFELLRGSNPGYKSGGELGRVDRQLNFVLVSSSGGGTGRRGGFRSLLGSEDSILIWLRKGQSRSRKPSRARGNHAGWWESRSWSSGSNERKISSPLDSQSRYGKTAKVTGSDAFSRRSTSEDFYYVLDQAYEYGKGAKENAENFIRGAEDREERFDVQGFEEQRRKSTGSREWVYRDEESGHREDYRRRANRRGGKVYVDDDGNVWDCDAPKGRRAENDQMHDRTTRADFYEENLEENRKSVRSPFIDEMDNDNDQIGNASADRILLEQAQKSGRDSGEANAQSPGLSGRVKNEAFIYDGKLGSRSNVPGGTSYDGRSVMDRRRPVRENEKGRPSSRGDYLDDDERAYVGQGEKSAGNLSLEENLPKSKLEASRAEQVWQRSRRRREETYPSNPVMDNRAPIMNRENSTSIEGEAQTPNADYDDVLSRRRSPRKDWDSDSVVKAWSPAAGDDDDENYYQNNTEYKVSGIAADGQLDEVLAGKESPRRDKQISRRYGKATEVLARGALYAKQVISQATAQSLGVVSQLWVDMESLKVVALEVRPNLLFGDFNCILLKSLSKVGDVILIHDEDDILEELNLFNCYDLVGSDLFSEVGFYLGKVRNYNFSLEDGAVLSIEFDTFGVPLIPSTVISTYSFTVDEVIEAQEDGLLLRKGAEKRVRKLTKGLFSRPKQPPVGQRSLLKDQRKQLPQLSSSRGSSAAAEVRNLGQASARTGGVLERDEYTPEVSTSREKPQRESRYSENRRGVYSESSGANDFESDQAQDLTDSRFSSRNEYYPPQELEDYQPLPPLGEDVPVKDTPQVSDRRQTEPPGARVSAPEVSRIGRGLPMSYRTPKRRIENDL